MKVFTVNQREVLPYITVAAEPYAHVALGESGRGRQLTRVPVGRNLQEQKEIGRASVIRTREKGTLMLVEERQADDRALVKLAVPAALMGATEITGGRYEIVPCPHRGWQGHWSDLRQCSKCGSPLGENREHPDEGTMRKYDPLESAVTVLAKGWCAQGDAGRMGGHRELLLVLAPGQSVRVRRYGRLYGAPKELFVHWDGSELRFGTEDEVFPPTGVEEDGELL